MNELDKIKISRIFNAQYLISDITNHTLTFSHPSSFDDMWELQTDHLYFIQCWGINQNNASWEIYDKDRVGLKVVLDLESICINSLTKQIQNGDSRIFGKNVFSLLVDYSKSDNEIEKLHKEIASLNLNTDNKSKIIDFLKYKKSYYSFEKELRFVLDLDTKRTNTDNLQINIRWNTKANRHIRIVNLKYDWTHLIESVEINPLASENYAKCVREQLILAGLKSEKIRYKEANMKISLDFDLLLESRSSGKFKFIDNFMLGYYCSFVEGKDCAKQYQDDINDFIKQIPEHIVFNMVFNYLEAFLNEKTKPKQRGLERRIFEITRVKILENTKDVKNTILLLFLAVYMDEVEHFLEIYSFLCEDKTIIDDMANKKHNFIFYPKCNNRKYLRNEVLNIWNTAWQTENINKILKLFYEYYLESYNQYIENKALNKDNPIFTY